MNIDEIYNRKLDFFAKEVADMYNRFARMIDKDKDFTLADDEVGELFDELLLTYMQKQMSEYEFDRIVERLSKADEKFGRHLGEIL
jgi:hypothetical protein